MLENPHGVPPDEVVRMVRENPAEVAAQVVFGKYVESSGLVFTGELIQELFDRSLTRILGSAWLDQEAAAVARLYATAGQGWGDRYATGIDYARQTDFTVIFTLDCRERPARVVYYKRLNRVPWDTIYAEVGRARHLFGPHILSDATGPQGDVIMDALWGRNYCSEHHKAVLAGARCQDRGVPLGCRMEDYLTLSCVEGFQFTQASKRELVEHLRDILAVGYHNRSEGEPFGWLRCPPIPQLEEELAFYAWDDKRLSTDCLFALALAAKMGIEGVVQRAVEGSVY